MQPHLMQCPWMNKLIIKCLSTFSFSAHPRKSALQWPSQRCMGSAEAMPTSFLIPVYRESHSKVVEHLPVSKLENLQALLTLKPIGKKFSKTMFYKQRAAAWNMQNLTNNVHSGSLT